MLRPVMNFEIGPIRPPSEAGSLLIRFTRNCPWNQCRFCPIYKNQRFSRRTLEEIKTDIDAVHEIMQDLEAVSRVLGFGGRLTPQVINEVLTQPLYNECYRHVATWAFVGNGTVFIQDADSLILNSRVLVEVLRYLNEKVPGIRRITSYARSSTISRKSTEEIKEIREAGLDRIHIGLESGSDRVLAFIKKGVKADQHIEAGRKVMDAGMTLSEYVMPGLGGKAWSKEHALETARVLAAIDPHFIRLRSLRLPQRAPLYEDLAKGDFVHLSDDETVEEIRLLIESLDGIHSTLTSDHIMNLLQEVEGSLPKDKEQMLGVIDSYLALPQEEKLLYRLGRRGGALQSPSELQNSIVRSRLERAVLDLQNQTGKDIESIITALGDQYV
ncbi:MAG: radical SAM protein [Syntrophobacteraceae bacterium]